MIDNKILGWDLKETKSLIMFFLNNKNIPMTRRFFLWSKQNNRQPQSVRNYFYKLKKLSKSESVLKKLNALIPNACDVFKSSHFSFEDEKNMLKHILNMANGETASKACYNLACGDKEKQTRFQNKFKSLLKNKREFVENVLKELKTQGIETRNPYENDNIYFMKEQKLMSKEDIKSLFLGILRLVQDEAKNDVTKSFNAERKLLSKKLMSSQKTNTENLKLIEKLEKENELLSQNYNNLITNLNNFENDFAKTTMEKLKNYHKGKKQH